MGVLSKHPCNFLLLPSETTEPPLPAPSLPLPHTSQLGFLWNPESVPWGGNQRYPFLLARGEIRHAQILASSVLPSQLPVHTGSLACTGLKDYRVQCKRAQVQSPWSLRKAERLVEKPCTSARKDSCYVKGPLELHRQHHWTRRPQRQFEHKPCRLPSLLVCPCL